MRLSTVIHSAPVSVIINSALTIINKITRYLRFRKKNSGNLVIFSVHRLGDSIFTLPAIKLIQQSVKHNLYLFCLNETKEIYEEFLSNINIVSFSKSKDFIAGKLAKRNIRKILKKTNPDIIIDLTCSIQSASSIFTSGARLVIGSNLPMYKGLYDKYIRLRETPDLMDMYLDIVVQEFRLSTEMRHELKKFPDINVKKGKILVQPFAGWRAKEWNIWKFFELIKKLRKNADVAIIVPAGSLNETLQNEAAKEQIEVIITNSINDLFHNLKSAMFFIGNDSGPVYIAAMLGVPTFTIYGPTNPSFHLPEGGHHYFERIILKCSPGANDKWCFTEGGQFGCPAFECMNNLTVGQVYKSITKQMNDTGIYKIIQKSGIQSA